MNDKCVTLAKRLFKLKTLLSVRNLPSSLLLQLLHLSNKNVKSETVRFCA